MNRSLTRPIKLRDGRVIETLADAFALLETIPVERLGTKVWLKTLEELKLAAETGSDEDIAHATLQLKRAIEQEGPRI